MMRAFVFIFGLMIGSFLNACIWRMRHGGSAWRGRSYCPKCKKPLRWYELIPLVSFALQWRRCRGCRQTIDWQYPAVELAMGILCVLAYNNSASRADILHFTFLISHFYLLSVLVVLFVYDLRYGLVPDSVVLPAIVIALLYHIFTPQILFSTFYFLFSTLIGAAFFAAQYYLSRGRWLGAGDIRIGALMGAMLGWPHVVGAIALSYMMGGAFGAALLLSGRKKFGQTLPLGTFLTLGTAIMFLYGPAIWSWYFRCV